MEHNLLVECLSKALCDSELIPDIASTCDMLQITVKDLAVGVHAPAEVAEKLFLTEEEAARLLTECQTRYTPSGAEVMITVDEEPETEVPAVGEDITMEAPSDAGAFHTPPDSPRRARELDVEEIPVEAHEVAVKLIRCVINSPAAKGAVNVPPPRPNKASASPYKKPDPLRMSCPAVVVSAPVRTSYQDLPSYLRPTAAAQARAKNAPEPVVEENVLPKKTSKKYRNVLARVLAPTKAFLARITGHGGSKDKSVVLNKSDVLRQSLFDKIMKSPQGKRVTEAVPFANHAGSRARQPEGPQLNSEEVALREAQKHMFRGHEVPKHVHEQRSIEGRIISTPKSPEQIFEPFNLASQERHAAQRAKIAAELAAQQKAEEDYRVFRALAFDKTLVDSPRVPPKPEPQPVTVPVAPRLLAQERNEHYEKVVAPARRARMDEAERAKAEKHERELQAEEAAKAEQAKAEKEERERALAMEKMDVEEIRRSLMFKARPMPGFDNVFRPDPAKAPKVTQSLEFKFRTDERLGKAISTFDRRDAAASQLGSGRYDGQGYSDAFSASLRSCGLKSPRAQMLMSPRSSLRSPMVISPSATTAAQRRRARVSASQDLSGALSSALGSVRHSTSALSSRMPNNAAGASPGTATTIASPRLMVR